MDAYLADVAQVVPTTFGRDASESVTVLFMYATSDPYAVVARFSTTEGEVDWTFGRELLLDGTSFPVGEGDVKLAPEANGQISLRLNSPSGQAKLFCDLSVVEAFLEQSYELVPDGEEWRYCQMDQWLAELSGQASN